MKKIAFMMLLSLAFLASCGDEEKKSLQGEVVFVQGKAQKSPDQKQWSDVKLKDLIREKDWMQTGDKSLARIRVWESTTIMIRPNTLVQLRELTGNRNFSMMVQKGGVLNSVQKINGYYKVSGPAISAGVRGTEFEFFTDGKKDVLTVKKGSVAVKRNIQGAPEKIVKSGETVIVSLDENRKLEKKLQGKNEEEKKKILEIPVRKTEEAQLPPEIQKEVEKQEQFVKEQSQKQEEFVKEESRKQEEMVEKKSEEIEQTTEKKSEEIRKDVAKKEREMEQAVESDDFGSSMLDKAREKKKKNR
jgi:hypothetical protein